jgi:hypothetical protein
MKKVLLLGDSIRQGYQEYVKDVCKEYADVYYPNDNGKFCQNTLFYFHDWARILSDGWSFDFDIIHFNSGLWDVFRFSNDDKCLNSPEEYRILLKRIVDRMYFFYPNAKIIFALTTKVLKPGFSKGSDIGVRKNSDIKLYNKIAEELFENSDIDINDLWSISQSLPIEAMSDCVHYETLAGREALGGGVAELIKKYC